MESVNKRLGIKIMTDMMVDIETLGIKPGSVITSIGAVMFSPTTYEIGNIFHERISVADALMNGFDIDVNTIKWWRQQSKGAQEELRGTDFIGNVLSRFRTFIYDNEPERVWARSPSFDINHLMEATRRFAHLDIISYRQEVDVRTVEHLGRLLNMNLTYDGDDNLIEHNPVSDCIKQIRTVQEYMQQSAMYIREH
jgi:hypothetical protein